MTVRQIDDFLTQMVSVTAFTEIYHYIVRTARNRALPSATRSYAFGASANGYVSTIVLTFPCATKSSAS